MKSMMIWKSGSPSFIIEIAHIERLAANAGILIMTNPAIIWKKENAKLDAHRKYSISPA